MWRISSARRKSLPSAVGWPGPRRMGLSGGGHGTLHQAVRRSSRLRLSLLRSHCHPRLPERPFAARAGGALLPPDCRRSGHQQEVLSQRTADYQKWVEAFARNRNIPIEWAEKGVRKEDYVQPWLRKMVGKNAYGV